MAPSQCTTFSGVLGIAAVTFAHEDDFSAIATSGQVDEALALKQVRKALGEELVPDAFLRKCLVYQQWDVQAAARIVLGFLRFRRAAKWPLRIPTGAVEKVLHTGFHWLLRPEAGAQTPADWDSSGDGGPAGCLVFNMSRLDPRVCSVQDYQKMSMFLMERATDDLETQQRGIAIVVDFRGMEFSRLISIVGVDDIRRGVLLWKGAFPCRLRRIWLLAPPSGIRFLTAGILQLLSPKVRNRVRIASGAAGLASLNADLGPVVALPESLGGAGGPSWDKTVAAVPPLSMWMLALTRIV